MARRGGRRGDRSAAAIVDGGRDRRRRARRRRASRSGIRPGRSTERVDDLMGRLTLDEKIALLHQYQPAIPRLGIGVFKAGTEALHGVAWSNDFDNNGTVVTANATAFPQALGLASTWDPRLIRRVGSVVGDEARGLHAQNPTVWGLNLWAPVVNLLRDPRWGRNEEGYSEDPALTSAIATAYGRGIQGDDPRHLKAAPTLKHFLAYNNEVRRDTTSSNLPPRVLHEYDEQAFEPTLRAGAATGVMASYNLVNGRPMTVDPMVEGTRRWSPLAAVQRLRRLRAVQPHRLRGLLRHPARGRRGDVQGRHRQLHGRRQQAREDDRRRQGGARPGAADRRRRRARGPARADAALPPRRVRSRRRPVRLDRAGGGQRPRPPAARPPHRRRGRRAAQERRRRAAAEGEARGRGRPARRHGLHGLVRRQAALHRHARWRGSGSAPTTSSPARAPTGSRSRTRRAGST